jgi:CDK inhibitor PHO81
MTPLHWACLKGHEEVVIELVDNWNADIKAKDYDRETPLHFGCRCGYSECVQVLVGAGADIRLVTIAGDLPIHRALCTGTSDVVKYLLQEFYASISDHEGRLPLHALLEDLSAVFSPLRKAL